MALDWPAGGIFDKVRADLAPLEVAYPDGTVFLPDGFEELEAGPLTNGTITAVPWEYHAVVAPRLRGETDTTRGRRLVVRGVTIVHESVDGDLFRRYVDWAGTWAQLGVSSGRGEQDDERAFLDPAGNPLDV